MVNVNTEIRDMAKAKGVFLWQIADFIGVSDVTFSKMLRHELPESRKTEFIKIIDQIVNGENEDDDGESQKDVQVLNALGEKHGMD